MTNAATTAEPPASRSAERPARLHYLDNLKVALIVLVVLHDAAQPYGPPDWRYVPGGRRSSLLESFTVVNGAFFMALFFAISAYLIPAACDRQGGRAFVTGRLKRLGIPLFAGTLTVIPFLAYVYYRVGRDYPAIPFPRYYLDVFLGLGGKPVGWTGPSWPDLQLGHLWFIQHLLVYCLLYALWRALSDMARHRYQSRPEHMIGSWPPGNGSVLAVVAGVTALTAAIRVLYPVDRWEAVLGFIQAEVSDLGQYAALFVIGPLAARRGWLDHFAARNGYLWLTVGAVLALGFYLGHDRLAPYFAGGGANARQLLWSRYESALCVSLSVGLAVLFREKLNRTSRLLRVLAADSFAVYIIHVPVVVLLQLAIRQTDIAPLSAFAIVGSAAIVASFAIGHPLRRLPGLRSVLKLRCVSRRQRCHEPVHPSRELTRQSRAAVARSAND